MSFREYFSTYQQLSRDCVDVLGADGLTTLSKKEGIDFSLPSEAYQWEIKCLMEREPPDLLSVMRLFGESLWYEDNRPFVELDQSAEAIVLATQTSTNLSNIASPYKGLEIRTDAMTIFLVDNEGILHFTLDLPGNAYHQFMVSKNMTLHDCILKQWEGWKLDPMFRDPSAFNFKKTEYIKILIVCIGTCIHASKGDLQIRFRETAGVS